MKRLILQGLFALICMTSVQAQVPIQISLMDHSHSIGNHWFLGYAYNPAIMVGSEKVLRSKGNHDLHLTANLGFYHQTQSQSAAFINSEIGYRYRLQNWSANARLGLGYAHTFYPGPVYEQSGDLFVESNQPGAPRLQTSLSMGVGYRLGSSSTSPEIGLRYMVGVHSPLNLYTGIHQMVGLSFTFYPFQTKP